MSLASIPPLPFASHGKPVKDEIVENSGCLDDHSKYTGGRIKLSHGDICFHSEWFVSNQTNSSVASKQGESS
jgi:hypothetical protein